MKKRTMQIDANDLKQKNYFEDKKNENRYMSSKA